MGFDFTCQACDRALYEYLGLEFSLMPLEMETVYWNGASMGTVMTQRKAAVNTCCNVNICIFTNGQR